MGMALYYILSGEFPYDFSVRQEPEKKKRERDPIAFILGNDKPLPIDKKVSGIPPKISSAIGMAIEKDIQKRIQTAQEFKKALSC